MWLSAAAGLGRPGQPDPLSKGPLPNSSSLQPSQPIPILPSPPRILPSPSPAIPTTTNKQRGERTRPPRPPRPPARPPSKP